MLYPIELRPRDGRCNGPRIDKLFCGLCQRKSRALGGRSIISLTTGTPRLPATALYLDNGRVFLAVVYQVNDFVGLLGAVHDDAMDL